MNYHQLQHEIISSFRSEDLKNRLEESRHVFNETELLGIVHHFAPNYHEYLRLLKLLVYHAEAVSEHAKRCIAWQEKKLMLFCQNHEHEVYELRIKTNPNACEERYLCANYNTALEMIDAFYKKYECEETTDSRYIIAKRKIMHSSSPFDEDNLGECILGAGKVLISVDLYSDETENGICCHYCMQCENPCVKNIEVYFPAFIPNQSVVRYLLPDGSTHYGIHLSEDDLPSESCYIIPLDCEMLKNRNYDAHLKYQPHEHIPPPYVESFDFELLPIDLKENYCAFLQYLKNRK